MKKRTCGTCDCCCWALGIHELSLPAFTRCPHQNGHGCEIYGSHPKECQTFKCGWLIDLEVPGIREKKLRPDRSGVIVWGMHSPWGDHVTISEAFLGGMKTETARKIIDAFSRRGLVMLMRPGMSNTLIGPPEMVAEVSEKTGRSTSVRDIRSLLE